MIRYQIVTTIKVKKNVDLRKVTKKIIQVLFMLCSMIEI